MEHTGDSEKSPKRSIEIYFLDVRTRRSHDYARNYQQSLWCSMNEELLPEEIEALWIMEWVEPIGTLVDLIYGNLSQGSTQAWWDSISPIPF